MTRKGTPTVGDIVRVAHTAEWFGGRVGILKQRFTTGHVVVRWIDTHGRGAAKSSRIPEWDVHLEKVENLSDEEVAALMLAKLKGHL